MEKHPPFAKLNLWLPGFQRNLSIGNHPGGDRLLFKWSWRSHNLQFLLTFSPLSQSLSYARCWMGNIPRPNFSSRRWKQAGFFKIISIRKQRKQNWNKDNKSIPANKKHAALYSIVISYHLLALKSGAEFLPITKLTLQCEPNNEFFWVKNVFIFIYYNLSPPWL